MIVTWSCEFCGWCNDNNNGPCRHCGGQMEQRLIKGHWRPFIVKPPNKPTRKETEE